MTEYPKKYKIKVFDLKSSKVTIHTLFVDRQIHELNNNIIWNIKFDFAGETIEVANKYLLSESINAIRKIIEPQDFRLLVKCSDYDASHSGMQADMTAGTVIYKLKEATTEGSLATYDVLAESDINSVVSLLEQKKYINEMRQNTK